MRLTTRPKTSLANVLTGATYGRTALAPLHARRHWTRLSRQRELLPRAETVDHDPADAVTQTDLVNALNYPTAKWIRGQAPNGAKLMPDQTAHSLHPIGPGPSRRGGGSCVTSHRLKARDRGGTTFVPCPMTPNAERQQAGQ